VAPLEKLMKDRHEVLEKSKRKGRSRIFREMVAQMGIRLD